MNDRPVLHPGMNRERLRATLERDEGLNLIRHDVDGVEHIGYGFNLEIEWHDDIAEYLGVADEDEIQELTLEQANWILDWHIDEITKTISKRFPVFNSLSPLRQEVIMNMRFNLGSGGLRKFQKMWAAIEAENWDQASVQMMDSLWAKQVGDRAKRLSNTMKTDSESWLELNTLFDAPKDTSPFPFIADGDNPLAAFTDQELIDELKRRLGLLPSTNPLKEKQND